MLLVSTKDIIVSYFVFQCSLSVYFIHWQSIAVILQMYIDKGTTKGKTM